ncbi:M50 family metallopeptidase [Asticcacaulis solisilvae]|uniref:M50 family metallopeptidase n=1 Tax=Asticcacaulis solisilvae TaxID=1217274 RepID=UPI003FD81074
MLHFLAGVLPILLIISVIVTFHEYGHYSVARLFKTRIERFSVGFGKPLLSVRDKRGVEWCLSALPLGGYVKFAGDENIASMSPSAEELDAARESITAREGAAAVKDYFHFKPLWQRFLIILAGPMFNFVLAILIYTVMGMAVGEAYAPADIAKVQAGGPAATAGFQPGDHIVSVDGHSVHSFDDVAELVMLRADTRTPFVIERKGQRLTLYATPVRRIMVSQDGSKVEVGQIGLQRTDRIITRSLNPLEALQQGVHKTWQTLDGSVTYISRIFTGKENGSQISSIVGMTKVTGDLTVAVATAKATPMQQARAYFFLYLEMTAVISIGVGFLNLLPVPILDGGHLAFYLYQGVTKKPVSAGFQNVAFRVAVVLILGLMLFAFWNDINNHFGLGR